MQLSAVLLGGCRSLPAFRLGDVDFCLVLVDFWLDLVDLGLLLGLLLPSFLTGRHNPRKLPVKSKTFVPIN